MGGYCLLVQKMQIKKEAKFFNYGKLYGFTFYHVNLHFLSFIVFALIGMAIWFSYFF